MEQKAYVFGKTERRFFRLVLMLLAAWTLLFSAGCAREDSDVPQAFVSGALIPITPTPVPTATTTPAPTPTPSPAPEPLRFSMWIPYWDYAAAIGELPFCSRNTTALIGFGAIFDAQDRVRMVPDMVSTSGVLRSFQKEGTDIYLSFVNDIELATGGYSNKEWKLLERLFLDEASMDAHIADVLSVAAEYGVDGIEIDYENVEDGGDALWQPFVRFIEKLYAQTEPLGLKLRVVLGWNFAQYASFPSGPEYVVMCYNLYGYHSGPGPKADANFLSDVYSINQSLPGRAVMAFATGGFDWASDGSITALTERQAGRLLGGADTLIASAERDEASRCMRFTYTKDGKTHEVWYADMDTLLYWRQLGIEAGYRDFALFRLGGNQPSTLRAFTAPD